MGGCGGGGGKEAMGRLIFCDGVEATTDTDGAFVVDVVVVMVCCGWTGMEEDEEEDEVEVGGGDGESDDDESVAPRTTTVSVFKEGVGGIMAVSIFQFV